jgi:hypothetical protein
MFRSLVSLSTKSGLQRGAYHQL